MRATIRLQKNKPNYDIILTWCVGSMVGGWDGCVTQRNRAKSK